MKGTAAPTDNFYLEKRMRSFVYLSSAKLEPLYAHIKELFRNNKGAGSALRLLLGLPCRRSRSHRMSKRRSVRQQRTRLACSPSFSRIFTRPVISGPWMNRAPISQGSSR